MRLRAVDAVESGVHPEDVAASLGMGRGTVYGWLAKYREGGQDALRARPVPGRPPKLSGVQMRRLYTLITAGDGDGDETVRIWDPRTGQARHTLTGHTSAGVGGGPGWVLARLSRRRRDRT